MMPDVHCSTCPNCLSLTANTNQEATKLAHNTVSPKYNTIQLSEVHQDCLSLTANTTQAVQQLNQNVVSPNYNTIQLSEVHQDCLSLTANTNQEAPKLAHNTVSPNYNQESVFVWLNSNKIMILS